MNILEQIKSPADLKYLSIPKMQALATQIRELIIKTVSQNGLCLLRYTTEKTLHKESI